MDTKFCAEMITTRLDRLTRFLLLLLLTVLAITGCGSPTPATTTPPPDDKVEEYAVYSALIQARYINRSTVSLIVLQDQTSIEWITDEILNDVEKELSGLTPDILQDLKDKNREPQALDASLNLSVDYVFISQDELQTIFNTEAGWDEFYKKYPASQGIMTLSSVGFSKQRDQALVYVGNQSNELLGVGFYYLLTKSGANWIVEEEIFAWIL